MASLFELEQDLIALRHCLEKEEDGEIDPVLLDWITEKEGQLEKKVEGHCGVIAELESMAAAREAESKRAMTLAKSDAAKAARMRKVRLSALHKLQIDRIDTIRHKVRLQNAGGKLPLVIDPFEVIPDRFQKTVTTTEIDRDAVRTALDAGEVLSFASLAPRSQILVIK